MRSFLLALAILSPGAAACAQELELPGPVRAAADAITADQLDRDLRYLASDALLGRNTPSPGFDSAAAYIARRLERAGLTPLGNEGGYFQHYDLREESIDTAAAYLEVTGRRFRFGQDFIMRSFAGPLSGSLPVVYVGHGWSVPGQGVDPYEGVEVAGKLVLAHDGAPTGLEIRQIGRVTPGASSPFAEARRRGAAGLLLVPTTDARTRWDELRPRNTTRLELEPGVPSAYAALPATSVLLGSRALEALLEDDGITGAELAARGEAGNHPASFQLARPATLHIPLAASVLHRPYNVVALVQGSDPVLRNEYITIASHLDGAVGSRVVDGDSIYNSADDNASGSAANLAIAERMMEAPRPKRSLVFIWDSGEERGLWGTRHFVHDPPVPLESIVAHFNIDMIGANRAPGSPDSASMEVTGPREVYLVGPGTLSEQADSLLERTNRAHQNLLFNRRYDRADSEFFYPRTDAGPFLERGVLTIGFFTGLHDRYHAPADEADYLDPDKMEAIARTVFTSVWMLADADERPRIDKAIPETVPRYR